MFDVISSNIVWAPAHLHARETLLLDFENSPHLDRLYLDWKGQISGADAQEILESLLCFLRTAVFDIPTQDQKKTIKLLKSFPIPLDYFVEHRLGVCRHFAFAAYYFLEKAKEEQLVPIKSIEIISKDFKQGRHAWLCVVFESGSFHFDPYWGILDKRG